MYQDDEFRNNLEHRVEVLKDFRKDIKDADMPQWMLDDLDQMHRSFPDGTAVRCRSSTNNEDLPGFSGAGLYTSKTQHLDEGHISKSIKQVYASMWNFRAFEERDFYRIDHYKAAMGVLCHPNYSEEKANGVGVTIDPIYGTYFTYYINTQVGENLVTNPDANSIPEEVILEKWDFFDDRFIRYSNQVGDQEEIMTKPYRDEIREYLTTIHDEFSILYNAVGEPEFAMDIEYKITRDDRLAIKQARPWASYWTSLDPVLSSTDNSDVMGLCYPNPFEDKLWIDLEETYDRVFVTDMLGVRWKSLQGNEEDQLILDLGDLTTGHYVVTGMRADGTSAVIGRVVKK